MLLMADCNLFDINKCTNVHNQTYKKTSFLTGVNSDYIEEYYSLYLQNPKLLPKDWIEFFDGLKEDSKNIVENIKGPSWSPKKIKISINDKIGKSNYIIREKWNS